MCSTNGLTTFSSSKRKRYTLDVQDMYPKASQQTTPRTVTLEHMAKEYLDKASETA